MSTEAPTLVGRDEEIALRKKFWAMGGSAENIWTDDNLFSVMDYVIERQGKKMAVYHDGYYSNICYVDF